MSDLRYRPNVAAIIRRSDGKILVGERSDVPGGWQFPQGGRKKQETPEQALTRELREEVGLGPESYRFIKQRGPYRYLFMEGRTKDGFHGQEQTYFLLELDDTAMVDVGTAEPEFRAVRWIKPGEFVLGWVPGFKREVYRQVFLDFFGMVL